MTEPTPTESRQLLADSAPKTNVIGPSAMASLLQLRTPTTPDCPAYRNPITKSIPGRLSKLRSARACCDNPRLSASMDTSLEEHAMRLRSRYLGQGVQTREFREVFRQ